MSDYAALIRPTDWLLMDHWLRHRGQNAEVVSTAPLVPPLVE